LIFTTKKLAEPGKAGAPAADLLRKLGELMERYPTAHGFVAVSRIKADDEDGYQGVAARARIIP
jgi:hypothetical protein